MPPLVPVEIRVNGRVHALQVPSDRRLLDVLREDLGLTGAKEGCGQGECGACTVMLDGEAVCACMVPAFQADGREIVTVEGLGTPEQPSEVQKAFVAATAAQCGFCTPGMVVAVTSLLHGGRRLGRQEVREGLSGNVCRCTGYKQIVDAAMLAQDTPVVVPDLPDRVGVSVARVDALDKVTGRTLYTADLPIPPDCLHGVTVRADRVHARLLEIRTDAALEVPGVVRVLTWRDVPGELHYGNAVPDQPVLVKDRIRFWGEAVAVVLAEDEASARAGAALVEIVAEDLPPLLDPAQALTDAAPRLHENGNLLTHLKLRKGDVDGVFATADAAGLRVVRRTYTTPQQEHLYLEPDAALAFPDADGGLTMKAPSQNVFFDRHHLVRTLGLPRNKVRVIQMTTGGAFGGREDLFAQVHAGLGALLTGRPVRIVWTREETQVASTKRHAATMDYEAAVAPDGTLKALRVSVLADTGAYASWGPNIARKMLVHAAGPYEIEHVAVDVRMAYTNNGFPGAFRGYGAPQVLFAVESFMDEVAAEVGRDRVAFRRHNHLAVGRRTATGQEITRSCGLRACLDQALARADEVAAALPPPPPHVRRGRGVATILYGIGYGNGIPDIGSATCEIRPDGRFLVRCGAVDYGQGAVTLFTQVACEVLGLTRREVEVLTGHSEETPDSGSTVASRQTYVSGEAVREASERLRDALLDHGAARWNVPRQDLLLAPAGLVTGDGTVLATLAELAVDAEAHGVKTRRQSRFKASTTRLDLETGQGDAYWPYAFATQVALVDVDVRTGQVRVTAIVAAHDVGKAIHPAMIEGQVAGGVAQGLGYALMEDHRYREGVPITVNLDTYRVPGPCDVPDVHAIIVEDPEPTGPFGAKGVGEPVLVAIAPAIANAVADAVGVRIRSLPVVPEKVLQGLRRQGGRP